MIITEKEKYIQIEAEEGMILTDGETYTYVICVPKGQDYSNWREEECQIQN